MLIILGKGVILCLMFIIFLIVVRLVTRLVSKTIYKAKLEYEIKQLNIYKEIKEVFKNAKKKT